jgi:hypothetical protein
MSASMDQELEARSSPKGFLDLTGQRFGKLFVVERADSTHYGATRWRVRCDCGKEKLAFAANLRRGTSQSCGCGTTKWTHRQSGGRNGLPSGAYKSWHGMLQRCVNSKCEQYSRYGGRGISVCARWYSFENFYNDMGARPFGKSLDRIDPNGNYEPGNCRWASTLEQARNTRANVVDLDRVQEIIGRFEYGESRASIGRRFGIPASYIGKIISGGVWREVERSYLNRTREQVNGGS